MIPTPIIIPTLIAETTTIAGKELDADAVFIAAIGILALSIICMVWLLILAFRDAKEIKRRNKIRQEELDKDIEGYVKQLKFPPGQRHPW